MKVKLKKHERKIIEIIANEKGNKLELTFNKVEDSELANDILHRICELLMYLKSDDDELMILKKGKNNDKMRG